jgi:phage terminase Nu1 subunit (DNA packaging protein)
MKHQQTIRWRINNAASEFGIDDETLSKRLKAMGVQAAEDGTFATIEVARAAFGDLERAKVKLTEAQAARQEVALTRERNEVLPVEVILAFMQNMGFAIRRVILTSPLPVADQDEILSQLQAIDREELLKSVMEETHNEKTSTPAEA